MFRTEDIIDQNHKTLSFTNIETDVFCHHYRNIKQLVSLTGGTVTIQGSLPQRESTPVAGDTITVKLSK